MKENKKPTNWGVIITIVITIVNVAFWVGTTKTSLEKEAERIEILNQKIDDEDDGLRADMEKADQEIQEDLDQRTKLLRTEIDNAILEHENDKH